MDFHARKLLVIIAEGAIERALIRAAMERGAHGYTVMDVRGGGRRGEREGVWDADRSVRIEIICEAATAEAIARFVSERYFGHYAVSLYVGDIGVLRPEKF